MKRLSITVVVLCLLLVFLVPAAPASAHVLKSDGTIGAVLHINPDDSPVSGSESPYDLAFKDTTGHFALNKCNCMVIVRQNGQAIYSHPLENTSALDSENTFTFPSADVYDLIVRGLPKVAGSFQPFNLDYVVRVEGGQTVGTQSFPIFLRIGLSMSIGLILLAAYNSEYVWKQRK